MRTIFAAASDFAFLFDRCPRCWWRKRVARVERPGHELPKIFNTIDRLIKSNYEGRRMDAYGLSGTLKVGKGFVKSTPIEVSGVLFEVGGYIDCTVEMDDGTTDIEDFKTSTISIDKIQVYSDQMGVYAYALSHPNHGEPATVSGAGLIVWEPSSFTSVDESYVGIMQGEIKRYSIPYAIEHLMFKLEQMAGLVKAGIAPDPSLDCPFCNYAASVIRLANIDRDEQDNYN